MKKNVITVDGSKRETAMLAAIPPNNVMAAVFLRHTKMRTSIPIPLARCPKVRHVIRCQIVQVPSGDIIGEGYSFCRPPDKFNQKEGATRAFRRAVDGFCYSKKFMNYFDDGSFGFNARLALWNQFRKTKAWKRVVNARKAKNNNQQER